MSKPVYVQHQCTQTLLNVILFYPTITDIYIFWCGAVQLSDVSKEQKDAIYKNITKNLHISKK
jgi:hypothetical protein